MRSAIERNVMGTVRVVYAIRQLVSWTAFKLYVFVLSGVGIAFLVSLPNVVQNFSAVGQSGWGSILFFIVSAILGTTLVVQIALLLGIAAFFSLFLDAIHTRASERLLA